MYADSDAATLGFAIYVRYYTGPDRRIGSAMSQAAESACRVLHVASGDLWAGAESQIFEILTALQTSREVEVAVVLLNPGTLADRLSNAGVSVEILDESRLSFPGIQRRLIRIARDWSADIVHSHRRKEHLLAGVAALTCNAHAVATVHGRSETSDNTGIRERVLSAIETLSLRRLVSTIIAVSDDLAGDIPVQAEKVEILPNGINVADIRRRSALEAIDTSGYAGKNIAFVGRLVPVKRVDRTIRACERLADRHGIASTLHVVGDGPLRPDLEQIAGSLESDRFHVVFHGFQTNPLPLLKGMNALLFSSDHEGLPMTALEALALGVPVVAPAIGGLTTLLDRSGLGYLALSGEPEDLAATLRDALTDPPTDSALLSRAVPDENRIDSTVAAYCALYRKLLAS